MLSVETFVGAGPRRVAFQTASETLGKQGKEFDMRDEMDGRIWVENHEQFSEAIDGALIAAGAALRRLLAWDGTTQHLLALAVAFAATALTFNVTAA
jgi:hypothetical protein